MQCGRSDPQSQEGKVTAERVTENTRTIDSTEQLIQAQSNKTAW